MASIVWVLINELNFINANCKYVLTKIPLKKRIEYIRQSWEHSLAALTKENVERCSSGEGIISKLMERKKLNQPTNHQSQKWWEYWEKASKNRCWAASCRLESLIVAQPQTKERTWSQWQGQQFIGPGNIPVQNRGSWSDTPPVQQAGLDHNLLGGGGRKRRLFIWGIDVRLAHQLPRKPAACRQLLTKPCN